MKENNNFKIDVDYIINEFKKNFETVKDNGRRIVGKIERLFRLSITFKMTFLYTMKTIGILFFWGIILWGGFIGFLGYNALNNLKQTSQYVSSIIASNDVPKENIKKLTDAMEVDISIFSENKNFLYNGHRSNIINQQNEIFNVNNNIRLVCTTSQDIILGYSEETNVNGSTVTIELYKSLYREKEIALIAIIVWGVVSLIIIMAIELFTKKTIRKMVRPVHDITETIKDINVNNLSTRINVTGSHDELKELAYTVNNMFDRLEEAYEKQNQFVSDASHELRTPIAVIQGYANLLDRWGKNDKEVLDESIDAIKNETDNMKTLVENLLFLARADKHTQKTEKDNFDLSELMNEIAKDTKLIDNKNHEILDFIEENISLYGDRALIKQAVRILIDNSIKFTPEYGRIILQLYKREGRVYIAVEDTGEGIPKEDLSNIFDRFYRVDKSRTKDKGGTGLGLSIAKWIVSDHKGKINVISKVGQGTTIIIELS